MSLPADRNALPQSSFIEYDSRVPSTKGAALPWASTWVALLSVSALVSSLLVMAVHGREGFFVPVLATAICILAALFDAWTGRIPNPLTYTAILLGLLLAAAAFWLDRLHMASALKWLAAPELQQSLLGFGVCAILGVVGMLFARVGGGDIKLLAALGALLGLAEVGNVMIIGLTIALAYALLNLALFGRLNAACRVCSIRLLELVYLRGMSTISQEGPGDPPTAKSMVPLAVPLAIGLVISQLAGVKAFLESVR